MKIPFNIPYTSTESVKNIDLIVNNPLELNSRKFIKQCKQYFESQYAGYKSFMTSSCTSALEIIAIMLNFKEGDEIIMPSYNFVGVANAFDNHGATLKFADIEPETMNVSATSIKKLITKKTKAILVMHYAGVACCLNEIKAICDENDIYLIEDNAQGICAQFNNQLLGSFGDFSVISFDTMKNISCGEGGVLLCKEKYEKDVQEVYNNGTNKVDFFNKKVTSYEWVSKGAKFILSEYNAAVLLPLLKNATQIIDERLAIWDLYYELFQSSEILKFLTPKALKRFKHNAHLFYIKCEHKDERDGLVHFLQNQGISALFHYSPLHNSIRGKFLEVEIEGDKYTTFESDRLVRLPIYNSLSFQDVKVIVEKIEDFYKKNQIQINKLTL